MVRVTGFEPAASWSQRDSNLVLHVHELHLTLSAPENLLSGALFSAVSTSSGGGCGQLCGRMKTLPWNAVFCRDPRERLDCSALLPDSQGRFGYFYAHFLRRSRQRNTESRNTAFVFSKFCFCCYRKNTFRQFLLWNKNLPKFC